jgi:hypothetical protein
MFTVQLEGTLLKFVLLSDPWISVCRWDANRRALLLSNLKIEEMQMMPFVPWMVRMVGGLSSLGAQVEVAGLVVVEAMTWNAMNVESLVILPESVVFALGLEDWALAAVVRALAPAQDIVAAQATAREGTVTFLLYFIPEGPREEYRASCLLLAHFEWVTFFCFCLISDQCLQCSSVILVILNLALFELYFVIWSLQLSIWKSWNLSPLGVSQFSGFSE